MELTDAIKGRRSVRKFTEDYVSDSDLKEIIDAARLAPSWSNTQVWRFIAVRDRKLIEKVTATYAPMNPATKGSITCSLLIVACAKKGESGIKAGMELTKFANWFMFDLGMAVQNICLRAHDLGLGTVVVGLLNHDACAQALDVPSDHEVVAVIPVGKPLVAGKEGPQKKGIDEILFKNKFGMK